VLDPGVNVEVATDLDHAQVIELYRAVGWTAYTNEPNTLRAALSGSTRVVIARRGQRLVGLARVVSDGASIAYLQDVVVNPNDQRIGIGTALVRAALAPYDRVRQKVLLTDDDPAHRVFYEHLGYHDVNEHPGGSLRAFVRFDD